MLKTINEVSLAKDLVKCQSVTPKDDGAINIVAKNLKKLGFEETADSAKPALISEVKELYDIFKTGIVTRKPVDGSVAQGKKPFTIAKGNRDLAKSVKMPIPYSETSLFEGKVYYEIFCDHCHGEKGDGGGALVKKDLFLKPPAYNVGTTKDLDKKMNNFKAFYQKAKKDKLLQTYKTVNLHFDRQVVCTKF